MMDFVNQLFVTLPPPVFALLAGISFALLFLLFGFGLWFLILLVALIPGTDFLFVDIEENLARSIQRRIAASSPKPRSYRTGGKNRELQSQLKILLRGDIATGNRLLKQQRQLNPGMSDNWYLEKVIYDLERDRQ